MRHTAPRRPIFRITALVALAAVLVAVAPPGAAGASAPARPVVIPDAALLQASDLHGAEPSATTGDYWLSLQPPQPCADRPYRSTALRRAERGIMALVDVGGSPDVVMEHVALYRSDGAHRYLRELRRAVAACPPGDAVWTVLATRVAGNESMLLSQRTYIDYAGMYHNTYVLVARVGRALVVLVDVGWETASGDPALVREFAPAAVRRAAILNRR